MRVGTREKQRGVEINEEKDDPFVSVFFCVIKYFGYFLETGDFGTLDFGGRLSR